jgi:hypothetical protein
MRFNSIRTSSISGLGLSSHRMPALAFVTKAASGWLTSWAIDAAIAPIVVCRLTSASSRRETRN